MARWLPHRPSAAAGLFLALGFDPAQFFFARDLPAGLLRATAFREDSPGTTFFLASLLEARGSSSAADEHAGKGPWSFWSIFWTRAASGPVSCLVMARAEVCAGGWSKAGTCRSNSTGLVSNQLRLGFAKAPAPANMIQEGRWDAPGLLDNPQLSS